MCLRIFKPTPRRLLLFLIFLAFTLSGLLTVLPPFQQLFGLPYVLSEGYPAFAAQIIYSYILACIYAFGYVWLDARIRKRYPHMNDIVQRRQSLPVAEEPVIAPEPPAVHKPRAPRKPARIKKAMKRHKR